MRNLPPLPVPERIVLVGCAGTGKATLAHARRLRFTAPHQTAAWLARLSS